MTEPLQAQPKEIGLATARELIDFSGGRPGQNEVWEGQLEGAVALHNILVREGCAYLADEVGMGKTYVALGVVALLRHFNPGWRVLYIAPRENIQRKWMKELANFTAHDWRVIDNRVKAFDGGPAYGLIACGSLIDLVRQSIRNPRRDFLLRMTSFSLPLASSTDQWRRKRDELLAEIPWLNAGVFDLRNKDVFKTNYARAVNAVLPFFDLVIVDEGHNLKHGLDGAARNHMIAHVLGHHCGEDSNFPHYGRRFRRVLLLSATPLESDYRQLWNQLDLFEYGEHGDWPVLRVHDPDKTQQHAQEAAAGSFLVRRLTGLSIGGRLHTKNMYRREWRQGGVAVYDAPLEVAGERQRLIVALVQKKVAEILGKERFNHSFQIGMLASFESFLQTAGVSSEDEKTGPFDDADQTDEQLEREGIDTGSINALASTYRRRFGTSLPHPKMDSVADSLKDSFCSGAKALVFVRRVASTIELAEKLNRHYDAWLKARLLAALPVEMREELERAFEQYETERCQRDAQRQAALAASPDGEESGGDAEGTIGQPADFAQLAPVEDEGDDDNFFAWFFRGKGPQRLFSGAAFNKNRLNSEGSAYSTFYEDNYVAWLLEVDPGDGAAIVACLADQVGLAPEETRAALRKGAYCVFHRSSRQKKYPRRRVFFAYQEAALTLLVTARDREIREQAQVLLRERFTFPDALPAEPPEDFPAPDEFLAQQTFFTELVKRPALRAELWPDSEGEDFRSRLREREQRRELLSAAARLGQPTIDLWLLAANRLGSLKTGVQERAEDRAESLIADYLDLLERQRGEGGAGAFLELSAIARHFDLILAVNFPAVRAAPLITLSELFGRALARQTPVSDMAGGVNKTVVTQFRMPGYPLILVTTDVLQEGEDLHTFCDRVIHYGISWTPSSMEQRTGRVDRIHSLTQRRLDGRAEAKPDDLLQVYYPHLQDTVERLQVERVFERMNRFMRMLHRSLSAEHFADSRVNTLQDFIFAPRDIQPIAGPLKTAFPIKDEWLHRDWPAGLIAAEAEARAVLEHFAGMMAGLDELFDIEWEPVPSESARYGTVYLLAGGSLVAPGQPRTETRRQPFRLLLRTAAGGGRVLLRCVSRIGPIGESDTGTIMEIVDEQRRQGSGKVCAVLDTKQHQYHLTAEAGLFFHPDATQVEEVADLLRRTVACADHHEAILSQADAAMTDARADLDREALDE